MNVQMAIADVRLNFGGPIKRMLVIFNEHGTLLVDDELYSTSFAGAIPCDININYIKSVKL